MLCGRSGPEALTEFETPLAEQIRVLGRQQVVRVGLRAVANSVSAFGIQHSSNGRIRLDPAK